MEKAENRILRNHSRDQHSRFKFLFSQCVQCRNCQTEKEMCFRASLPCKSTIENCVGAAVSRLEYRVTATLGSRCGCSGALSLQSSRWQCGVRSPKQEEYTVVTLTDAGTQNRGVKRQSSLSDNTKGRAGQLSLSLRARKLYVRWRETPAEAR